MLAFAAGCASGSEKEGEPGESASGRSQAEAVQESAETAGDKQSVSEAQYYKIDFADWFKSFEVTDLSGNQVTEAIFQKADVTLINIWGTFCGPCIDEMPALGEIDRSYRAQADADGKVPFQIIGLVGDAIMADENGYPIINPEIQKTAEDIASQTKADYVHLMPTGNFGLNVMGTGEIQYFPTSIFVDSEGTILKVNGSDITVGGHNKAQWESLIADVLAQEGAV